MELAHDQAAELCGEGLARRAEEIYERDLRQHVETPENIGRMLILDVESGDYEIDDEGTESSRRLQARHPGKTLFGIRIGYKTAISFAGGLERIER